MRTKLLSQAGGAVLTLALSFVLLGNSVYANSISDYGHLVDDYVYENTASMSAAQIDSFLNSFSASCISTNNGFSTPDPTGWSSSVSSNHGYTFGGNVSAGKAIYDASQIYHLSPEVILTTLQKEQSVVTGSAGCHYNNPSPGSACTYSGGGCVFIAMSYACPGSCDYSYNGFSLQLIAGSWLLRFAEERAYGTLTGYPGHDPGDENISYSGPMTAGYRQRSSTDSVVYYDGTYTTQDGKSVTIADGSTAALYYYTPFTSGNTSFVNIFNLWFGSTIYPEPLGGILYYQSSTGKVYLVTTDNGVRYFIPSWSLLQNYLLDRYQIIPATDTTIQQYTDGGTLTNLVWDNNGVFLVNNGIKYHVSPGACTAWGFACSDNTVVKQLGSLFQEQYLQNGTELGNLASYKSVYYQMNNGSRLPIGNTATFNNLGYVPGAALNETDANATQPLGTLLLDTPAVLSFSPNQTVYYFDGTNYYSVPSPTSYNDWALGSQAQLSPPVSSYNTTPPSSQSLTPWYQDSSANKYIVDEGRLVKIPTSMQNLWQSYTFSNQPTVLASQLPVTSLQTDIWSNGVYVLSNGSLHHVPTWNDYLALGISQQSTTSLLPDKVSSIPIGNDALGDGIIIALQSDNQGLYVINNGKTTHVPDPNTYNDYGFSWNNILDYPNTILNDYPLSGSPLSSAIASDGTYYVVGAGSMYKLSPSMASDFGAQNNLFQSVSIQTVSHANAAIMSRFLHNVDDGRIYYASGGAIHYIATYNAFVAYGGLHSSISQVNGNAISLFNVGQSVY